MVIRADRIEKDFTCLAEFGKLDNGGVTRLALSTEDMRARHYLSQAMQAAGLQVRTDAMGNQFGTRNGVDSLPPVLIGSHLDTVPNGGHFDGVIGVIAALEVLRVMNEANLETRRPVEIVNFSIEESSRFGVATLGSKALAGKVTRNDLERFVDEDGISLGKALRNTGYAADPFMTRLGPGEIHAFLEMHIEQGPILEKAGIPVGIVTSVAAPTRFKVIITGRADHSGTTPMAFRRDALAAASEIVLGVERIAGSEAGVHTVGTVGCLRVKPGVMNVVPEQVGLGIDVRDIDADQKRGAVGKIVDLMEAVAARRRVVIDWKLLADEEPVAMSGRIKELLQQIAQQESIPFMTLPSGAGHDAMNMAQIADAGMIFIPSIGGISHNIAEKSRMEDICRGSEILLRAVIALANE